MKPHVEPVKTYLAVFGALLALTGATVGAAFLDLGFLNTLTALGIAGLKASLVVLFFMHVRHSSGLVRLFAAAGFFWVGLMLVITFSDYLTRGW
jgi:cytochrome c oxidase subunit 4